MERSFALWVRVILSVAVSGVWLGPAWGENRTIDGSGNNPVHPSWGSAGSQLVRLNGAAYGDGVSTPAGANRPSARVISNTVAQQTEMRPDEEGRSDYLWLWGQFIDHDVTLVNEAAPAEPFNICVPPGDPVFDPGWTGGVELGLNRSAWDPGTGTGPENPRQQVNVLTAWVDGSQVYGSDDGRAAWLRSGMGGLLKVSAHATGDLLPYNDGTQVNTGGPSTELFMGGDVRANEHAALASMHTLWMREHNRLAEAIAGANPGWSDEEIYQRARKLVGAEIQAITYQEYLPALLGEGALGAYGGYQATTNPSLLNEFSAAAYRYGHSALSPTIMRLDSNFEEIPEGNYNLLDSFFNLTLITEDGGIEPILRGLSRQRCQTIDAFVNNDVRDSLFGAFDLTSFNIQRGRDHGLPDYNQIREDMGLGRVSDFGGISSSARVQSALEAAYGSVDNIDPWVGVIAEDHYPGSAIGELGYSIIKMQFERLRDGDRFWYAIDPAFSSGDLADLESVRLGDIIAWNTGITGLQENVFFVPEPAAAVVLLAGVGLWGLRRRRG